MCYSFIWGRFSEFSQIMFSKPSPVGFAFKTAFSNKNRLRIGL